EFSDTCRADTQVCPYPQTGLVGAHLRVRPTGTLWKKIRIFRYALERVMYSPLIPQPLLPRNAGVPASLGEGERSPGRCPSPRLRGRGTACLSEATQAG